ncbi:hypothetical protein C4544_06090 [candidate division WS5 bacterium]|uniref:Uncharacterized protein n=1 Tax=candidate division WS5 bacterium TaxID=2093353 RepID=A0A419DAP1_9BACT|nr:MAG: hypothetical protein C4544_06090 [candidate division WS5 bacterium]
MRFWNKESCSC